MIKSALIGLIVAAAIICGLFVLCHYLDSSCS